MTTPAVDWPEATLTNLGGRITSGSRGWATHYADHGSLFVRITNLRRDRILLDLRSSRFVDVDSGDAEARRTRLETGDLLISITADIGIIGYVDKTVPTPAYINQHIARVRLDDRLADSQFVAYYLASWGPQRRFVGSTDTGAKAGMNLAAVAALPTVVPPVSEQRRIASALSDADDLIAALERVILKRQAIKQGMMQELLTGRTRLPGFAGSWSATRLGVLGIFLKGRGVKRDDVRGLGVRCIRYGEIYTAFQDYTAETKSFVAPAVAATALALKTGDVLFVGSGETRDEIGKCVAYIGPTPAVAGGDVIVLRGDQCNPVYLALLANSPEVVVQKARAGQGDAVVHIYSHALAAIEVTLPPRSEQDAIAEVILDADREIRLLRDRLAKARYIKQGMMQELLTGRTRLPESEVVT
jgi:type I restriction enzyme S subunit